MALSDQFRKSGFSTTGSCLEARWKKSSVSNSFSNCVEARIGGGGQGGHVEIRDSKDRAGPVLPFTPAEWSVFLAAGCPVT